MGTVIPIETFVEAALYAPEYGYYRRQKKRVGFAPGRDFYTAESLGPVFTKLVLAAVTQLLPQSPDTYSFVELGAETRGGMLAGQAHPFACARAVSFGQEFALSGPCVVFSNELFDAQPFRRFEAKGGHWTEHAVRIGSGELELTCIDEPADLPADLPEPTDEDYIFDYPSGANRLLDRIVKAPWYGLFLAFDYGLDRATLARFRPAGTARTYHQHTMGADLLAQPGERDITHHICWDALSDGLAGARFNGVELVSQEAFFMRRAVSAMESIVALGTHRGVHRDLQSLKELLHPEQMGRKFQVLHGFRSENTCQGFENC